MALQMKTLHALVFLSSISQVLLFKYAPLHQPSHLVQESAASPNVASLSFSQHHGSAEPSKTGETSRKLGLAHRRIYPLNFVQSRKEKRLNLTLGSTPLKGDKVESRIMNKPQPYPEFAVRSTQTEKEEVPDTTPNPIEKFTEDPELPVLPTTTQDISDVNEPNFPPQDEEDDAKLLKPRYASALAKKPPKYKILPLQMYNKVIVNPVEPPPPVNTKQIPQKWTSCICVPPYLCKDGIHNPGQGPRQLRSFIDSIGNKTSPYVQSKILNTQTNNPSDGICDADEICCELNSDGHIDNIGELNNFLVATSLPEIQQTMGPDTKFLTQNGIENKKCGVRSAYGIQAKLRQLQYPANVAEFGEYPWQVAILKKNAGEKNLYLCGGVLISPRWIASVAHCLTKVQESPLLVRLGDWDVKRTDEAYPYVEIDVDGVTIHPEFDPESLQNDVALIRMREQVDPLIPHVTPACLPTPGQVYDDKKCWVSGWGKDSFGPEGAYQNVLKEVDVPVVSRALCNSYLRSTNLGPDFVLHNGFLCAGGEVGKDACTGDGGSPLVCQSGEQWYVVGLVSWGLGCGKPGVPGVYVNVLYYAGWIDSTVNERKY